MNAVIDASVALKWFVEEPGSSAARQVLAHVTTMCAPQLLLPEVLNAVWKKQRRGEVRPEHATAIARVLPSYFTELVSHEALVERAMELCLAYDHPVYDCCYVALAQKQDSLLVSADERLFSLLDKAGLGALKSPLKDWE